MSDLVAPRAAPSFSLRRFWERRKNTVAVIGGLVAFALIWRAILQAQGVEAVRMRVNLSPLLEAAPVLQAHVMGAITSFLIGAALLIGVKGRTFHRVFGYAWIVAMTVTAVSSFFLIGLNGNSYSLIHLLSGWTVIVLPMALAAARRRDIKAHRKQMTGLFVGGMVIAGLFSFLPGRFMWHLFFTA